MSALGDDYTPEMAPEASSSAVTTETEGSLKDQRLAKMNQLRRRMQESSQANRKDAIQESTVRKLSAQESARLERKRKIAEALGEQIEAEDSGLDPERKRAWEYTVEDNERWDAKLAKKERRSKFEFTDFDDVARRKYKRDIDDLKVDLKSYNAQRREALGSSAAAAGTDLITTEAGSSAVQRANEMLYRDANSFVYADHKPSDEAIDKVVQKLNMEYVSVLKPSSCLDFVHDSMDKRNKFSRKRKEGQHDVTYINDKNKVRGTLLHACTSDLWCSGTSISTRSWNGRFHVPKSPARR